MDLPRAAPPDQMIPLEKLSLSAGDAADGLVHEHVRHPLVGHSSVTIGPDGPLLAQAVRRSLPASSDHGLILSSSGDSALRATSMSYAACARNQ